MVVGKCHGFYCCIIQMLKILLRDKEKVQAGVSVMGNGEKGKVLFFGIESSPGIME